MKAVATLLSLFRVLKEYSTVRILGSNPRLSHQGRGTSRDQSGPDKHVSSSIDRNAIFTHFILDIWSDGRITLTFIDPLTSQPKPLCIKTSILYVLILPNFDGYLLQ